MKSPQGRPYLASSPHTPTHWRCCWPKCKTPLDEPQPPLCETHLFLAWRFANEELRAVRDSVQAVPEPRHDPLPPTRAKKDGSVYFIRFNDRIKIGYSTNVDRRLAGLPHHEVLAVIPGTMEEERHCHAAFAHLRDVGEWFRIEQDLLDFIEGVKPPQVPA